MPYRKAKIAEFIEVIMPFPFRAAPAFPMNTREDGCRGWEAAIINRVNNNLKIWLVTYNYNNKVRFFVFK